ncbi:uncharacterized protein LOC128233957 isoform X2 [Mya arenaria]|uniref:uncharacterized protein LOC128233957 isoform X2 n=1 Tax=Mya arenaria TaxID=6604 RepID=UPI0022E2EC63|nr:uncharacterized protein LOC128233957 isoform X2 [Mya arenaria]
MDFDMLIQLFALLAVCIFVGGVPYYASKQVTLWGQSNCTLALLNLNYTDTGIFAETELGLNYTLPKEGLWIGLYQAPLGLAYVGCNKINNNGAVIVHDISECRWKSGCNTFAIRKTDNEEIECTCFDISKVAREKECTSTCNISSADEYKCGRERNSYFSVYTVENDTQCTGNCNNADRKCLRFMPLLKQFVWWSCSVRESRPMGIVCNNSPFTDIPAGKTHWTGIIRISSLLRFDETFTTYEPKQHAYVVPCRTRLDVRFDDRGTVRRNSLCETQNLEEATVTKAEGQSTSTSAIPETTEDTRTKTKVDQQVPVAEISASVSMVVVLGILIVIFVILRKRRGLRCFGKSKSTMANEESPMQYIDMKNTERQTRDHPKAYPNQGYSMTERLPISTITNTPGKAQMKDYSVDVNKMANTENNPQDIHHIAHVHNNLYQEPEEYDHLNHTGIPDEITINDYDSTTAAKGENKYDIYNHLNERPQQRTENVYGMHNKNETTDIYSQLNERPERKHMMENVYGLQDKNETENEYDITTEAQDTCMSKKASGFNYDKVNKNW